MTLRVHLPKPKSAAGYLAYYAGGTNGADPPYGQGYGGNDSSLTNDAGDWVSTWTVSPKAPLGSGHVDIYVSVARQGQGFKTLPFNVAAPGAC